MIRGYVLCMSPFGELMASVPIQLLRSPVVTIGVDDDTREKEHPALEDSQH